MKNKNSSSIADMLNKIKDLPTKQFQEELRTYIRITKLNILLICDLNQGRKHGNN